MLPPLDWIESFLAAHPVLRPIAETAALVLHGSTTLGIRDAHADIDLWLLAAPNEIAAIDAASPTTRFFAFTYDGRLGHFNVYDPAHFGDAITRCDLPVIGEWRAAEILRDSRDGVAAKLQARAASPMPEAVRIALFRYHYTQMRQAHAAGDNPIERGHAATILITTTQCLTHALCAALILDAAPYPYVKWLHWRAVHSPTGRRLAPRIDELLDLLGQNALRLPGPEKQFPISAKLKEIRNELIAAARESGIDEPWLEEWWLTVESARDAITALRWDDAL